MQDTLGEFVEVLNNTTKDFFHPPKKTGKNLAGEPVDHGAERRPSPA